MPSAPHTAAGNGLPGTRVVRRAAAGPVMARGLRLRPAGNDVVRD